MKIRSASELEDLLDKDLAWRKREFTTIKFLIADARNHEKIVLIRAGVALMYSHWEGHVKKASQGYLAYLNSQAHNYCDMKDNFTQLSLGEKFSQGFSIRRYESQEKIFKYLTGELKEAFKLDEKAAIDTESNLKYPVLLNIMNQLGLDVSQFELRENFINNTLLENRNKIAHGERLNDQVIQGAYNSLEKELLDLIVLYQNLIRNAVTEKSYLKVNSYENVTAS
ncbi:MAE_28990/MAE_18760 family HEPN-like nuclease [Thalassotalea agarivorans]|uniref:RiboL-PSP-HEPN domain-containing protein n=1 Tax=Thalassotalea agarivorans TaxID=349064 RepID=A0A1I0H3H8_THASX|nr:MAE_28990/MAE_18760 family HEPN-like nuclease [Thalassotalea agarivorans]SET78262.1 hypothetical protein SAMN05660429_02673 [Thalassotalea agarivorans]